ncbi:hypothetical protein KI387_009741, partial [Taxus chinensis]
RDARDKRTRTGRKESSQSESKWDKRTRNTRTGRTGRNCPKRSKIKMGRPGRMDAKYTEDPAGQRTIEKLPRVIKEKPKGQKA